MANEQRIEKLLAQKAKLEDRLTDVTNRKAEHERAKSASAQGNSPGWHRKQKRLDNEQRRLISERDGVRDQLTRLGGPR